MAAKVTVPCKYASGTRRMHMKTATVCFSSTLGNKAYGIFLNMSLQRFPRVCCLSTSVRAESPPPHNQLFISILSTGGSRKATENTALFFSPPSVRCFLQLTESDASAADSEDARSTRSFDLEGWGGNNKPTCLRWRACKLHETPRVEQDGSRLLLNNLQESMLKRCLAYV